MEDRLSRSSFVASRVSSTTISNPSALRRMISESRRDCQVTWGGLCVTKSSLYLRHHSWYLSHGYSCGAGMSRMLPRMGSPCGPGGGEDRCLDRQRRSSLWKSKRHSALTIMLVRETITSGAQYRLRSAVGCGIYTNL